MTNLEISLKADQIKIEVDLIKRSNLPQEIKDLAVLEAKKQIQSLKNELEFNKEYEDVKNYIRKGKEEMKKSSSIFREEFNEAQDFCNSVKKEMEEARKNFFQNF